MQRFVNRPQHLLVLLHFPLQTRQFQYHRLPNKVEEKKLRTWPHNSTTFSPCRHKSILICSLRHRLTARGRGNVARKKERGKMPLSGRKGKILLWTEICRLSVSHRVNPCLAKCTLRLEEETRGRRGGLCLHAFSVSRFPPIPAPRMSLSSRFCLLISRCIQGCLGSYPRQYAPETSSTQPILRGIYRLKITR